VTPYFEPTSVRVLLLYKELHVKGGFDTLYVGKSISKLQMDRELNQTRVLISKLLLFRNIISLYIEALVPSSHKHLKTSSIKLFGLLSEPGGDFPFYNFIVGKMFSRKMMFKRAEQMEQGRGYRVDA
jgi:hypothetical protein